MQSNSLFFHSTLPPPLSSPSSHSNNTHHASPFNSSAFSFRHFIKHIRYPSVFNPQTHLVLPIKSSFSTSYVLCSDSFSFRHFTKHLSCSSFATPEPPRPIQTPPKSSFSNSSQSSPQDPRSNFLRFPSFVSTLTPLDICNWATIISLTIAVFKATVNTLLNPFFWTYFSYTWLFWPWFAAFSLAVYGAYCLRKQSLQKANIFEQIAVVTVAITWLTLVLPAHFNGYLEGWPVVFFFAYHYFLFFEFSVRKRLYGDLYLRPHDPKWDITLPAPARLAFSTAVLVGHWFAASEGLPLHIDRGRFTNLCIWVLIAVAQFMKYHSTLYLAKYSEKVIVPMSVVQFGPYRWVRHPIYTSTMLLFAAFCVALRAPFSLLFLVGACLAYYDQKARAEEQLMVETFGEAYIAYMSKVPYKFIPLVY